ncbi:MAG: anthranilate phosphoribosyltransferase [Desulfovibrionaceae bacterium]|nr:anthranilate phosphoribosyltransferase [Desulfovibrionaceae bacterium]
MTKNSVKEILETLAQGRDLDQEQADAAFGELMAGRLTASQAGALLMGLRAKGATARELASAVSAALKHAKLVKGVKGKSIDTCGTGGDASSSFNCSTAVALFLAGLGYQVVKHGNRAVSSSCGSADAVEALGLPLTSDPEQATAELARRNFAFLFAPAYHPAFAHVMPVRKELGVRTLFNLMGPLLNPARPTHQLLGVGDPAAVELMAEALALTGIERALVVHDQATGFDELTPFGPTRALLIEGGRVTRLDIDPEALGFARRAPEDMRVEDKDQAVAALRAVLAGRGPEAMMDMAALNLAAALFLLEDLSLERAAEKAREAVASGLKEGVLDA